MTALATEVCPQRNVTRRHESDYSQLLTCSTYLSPPLTEPQVSSHPTFSQQTRSTRRSGNEETQRENTFAHPGALFRSNRTGKIDHAGISTGPHHLQPELLRRARALAARPEIRHEPHRVRWRRRTRRARFRHPARSRRTHSADSRTELPQRSRLAGTAALVLRRQDHRISGAARPDHQGQNHPQRLRAQLRLRQRIPAAARLQSAHHRRRRRAALRIARVSLCSPR